jgi:hypothetical protein
MIAIANVATTTALSHSAFIHASRPDKAVGDSRHTQHLNFSASTTKIKNLCIVLRQAILQRSGCDFSFRKLRKITASSLSSSVHAASIEADAAAIVRTRRLPSRVAAV